MNSQHRGFIDIHSHFLPGLDDGPENIDLCMNAARMYQDIGVDRVIATPHHIQGTKWAASNETILASVQETEEILSSEGVNIQVLPGMEIALTDHLCRDFNPSALLPLGASQYFLVECSLRATREDPAVMSLHKLCERKDSNFVLAHPERCTVFQENPEVLHHLVKQGLLVQINISSVIGLSGKKVQDTAFSFFRDGIVHFLATDSHARANRIPPDTEQMQQLFSLLGEDMVHAAFRDNPARMLAGEAVSPLQHEITRTDTHSFFPALHGLTESFKNIFRGN